MVYGAMVCPSGSAQCVTNGRPMPRLWCSDQKRRLAPAQQNQEGLWFLVFTAPWAGRRPGYVPHLHLLPTFCTTLPPLPIPHTTSSYSCAIFSSSRKVWLQAYCACNGVVPDPPLSAMWRMGNIYHGILWTHSYGLRMAAWRGHGQCAVQCLHACLSPLSPACPPLPCLP